MDQNINANDSIRSIRQYVAKAVDGVNAGLNPVATPAMGFAYAA